MGKILLIDFGTRYSQNLKDCFKELNIDLQVSDHTIKLEDIESDVKGIVLSGSPDNISEGGNFRNVDKKVLEAGLPMLGICYGHQLIHHNFGGKVEKNSCYEKGGKALEILNDSLLFKNMPAAQNVEMNHGDAVTKLAPGFELLAKTKDCEIAASQNIERKIYTTQFHPEGTENTCGLQYFKNFLEICGL